MPQRLKFTLPDTAPEPETFGVAFIAGPPVVGALPDMVPFPVIVADGIAYDGLKSGIETGEPAITPACTGLPAWSTCARRAASAALSISSRVSARCFTSFDA